MSLRHAKNDFNCRFPILNCCFDGISRPLLVYLILLQSIFRIKIADLIRILTADLSEQGRAGELFLYSCLDSAALLALN